MTVTKKIVALIASLLLGACGGPRIIPDRELVLIFHDIYLTNAYVDFKRVDIDSLNLYEPLLASYGYTSRDLQYTIGNFSKRKSARLAEDVVEPAGQMLLSESRYYRRRIEIEDSVKTIAREKFGEQVYGDSLIRVRRIADTSRLRITIDDIRPGSYNVSYGYTIDSLDRNTSFAADFRLMDADGRRTNNSAPRLTRGERKILSTDIATTDKDRRLVIALNRYSDDLTTPDLTIDSLRVTYYLPDEVAVPKLVRSYYADGGILDSLLSAPLENHETHLRPPLIDTARVRTR